MIERIKNWFQNDCPYLEGITIYQRIGGPYNVSIFTDHLQSNYIPDGVQVRLEQAITNYYENNIPHTSEAIISEPLTIEEPHKAASRSLLTSEAIISEPSQIKDLRTKAIPLHKLHSLTFFKMQHATTNEERYEHALSIQTELIPQIDHIYNQIRQWQESGDLPSDNTSNDIVQETIKKMNRIAYLNQRISRLKNKTEQVYKNEVLEKQIELQEIKQDLRLD